MISRDLTFQLNTALSSAQIREFFRPCGNRVLLTLCINRNKLWQIIQ